MEENQRIVTLPLLNSDHEALRYLNSQKKKSLAIGMHYTFSLRHKAGLQNKVADALSRRVYLLNTISNTVVGLEVVKTQYNEDPYFKELLEKKHAAQDSKTRAEFIVTDGFRSREKSSAHLKVP